MGVTIDEVTSEIDSPVAQPGNETTAAQAPATAAAADGDAELMDRLTRLEQRRLRLMAD
ncbi:hypothetical protein [Desulfatitalea alkaliphila]|uniref:Uncharacterized protein n=1 Tax=Desulfatitalea alkaliphila TaxID=2929485 RepID=A0AA41R0U9_9BACT|nr:hypothetical protein [Desulfatitalea alkaliphila]MCJ8500107.1 hypothetical protein [Desulfatitalea alkaliphila]